MLFKKLKNTRMSHAQTIALGFFLTILAGALLLMLPIASKSGQWTSFSDAVFTATSAACVTGLVVVDTFTYWTTFGQIVILLLIQIGGLGFVTMGVLFAFFLKKRIGLAKRDLIQESVSSMRLAGVVKLVKNILVATVLFEGIGAVCLAVRFIPKVGWIKGIYFGVFHSISAFCNAGFDLMGEYGLYSSLVTYYDDVVVNVVIMSLITIGGLGFIVWEDLYRNKFHFKKYSLHTKIVIISSCLLTFGGALLFSMFEHGNLMAGMSAKNTVLTSLFASVTARTAGFNTIDLGAMTQAGKFLTVILMFIGGSPGSTAGGIKTTTIVVVAFYVWSNIRNKSGCNILGRRIDDEGIKKASMVFCLNLFMAVTAMLIISSIQIFDLEDLMLEVFSAIGTVGLSTGITRALIPASRWVIIFLMYTGRIGSMTFALSFAHKKKAAAVRYPVENINVG
ncbi:MAG: TrkH family potassium uptake protein [Eubacteriales bacterium]|nr:TrkH family potassium uptake protein [Eubacteriales bacterium]